MRKNWRAEDIMNATYFHSLYIVRLPTFVINNVNVIISDVQFLSSTLGVTFLCRHQCSNMKYYLSILNSYKMNAEVIRTVL